MRPMAPTTPGRTVPSQPADGGCSVGLCGAPYGVAARELHLSIPLQKLTVI
jgi:hypothetical protein